MVLYFINLAVFAIGFWGLLTTFYWGWFSLVRPFAERTLGWKPAQPRPKLWLTGLLGVSGFIFCVVVLPILGRVGG